MHMSWVYFHSFIHISLAPLQVLYYSEALPTTARIYCIGVSRRSAQATAGTGLAQGPYVTARAGVEPTTLRLRVIASANAPPCPSMSQHVPGDSELAHRQDFKHWGLKLSQEGLHV